MSQDVLAVDGRVPTPTAPRATGRQPQIQALRAIAVLAVVLYHFWSGWLPGGYVGVDVFFVISGYLMTASILHIRADERTGLGGTLREFYARRLTRILPAAVVTLLACAVVTVLLVPVATWPRTFHEILAAAFFVENWALAGSATDYLGSTTGSPVQHFWSLSVEEQFYAVWPLVVFYAARVGPRVTPRGRTVKLLAVFGTLTVASLLYSVHQTQAHPESAYFETFSRFWELSFGAIVLVVDRQLTGVSSRVRRLRAGAGWLGLGVIGVTLLTFGEDTAFPGWRAGVPLLGTALVLLCSPTSAPWGPLGLLSRRPLQWVGDVSYSLYLVHWPLLVLVGAVATGGAALSAPTKLVLLPVLFVLAATMKRYVEDPFRRSRLAPDPASSGQAAPTRRPAGVRRTVVLVAVAQVAVLVVSVGGLWHRERLVDAADAAAAAFTGSPSRQATCFAAVSARETSPACPRTTASVLSVVPNPLEAGADWPYARCQQHIGDERIVRCDLQEGTRGRVVVAGDSHMTQWLPALLPWAASHDLAVTTYLKSGCALTGSKDLWAPDCRAWNARLWPLLRADPPDFLFTSSISALRPTERGRRIDGLVARWRELTALGSTLVAFRDIPQPSSAGTPDMPTCVVQQDSFSACTFDRRAGLSQDVVKPAAERVPGVRLVDLASYFCPGGRCQPAIDGLLVYINGGHMSSWWARGLSAALGDRLDRIAASR